MRIGVKSLATLRMAAFRVSALTAISVMVGACGFLPPSQQQEFAVTGTVTAAQPTAFLSTEPDVNAVVAKQMCADGYEVLGTSVLPSDKGDMTGWKVRCTPYYYPSL
jgi:hypothetical protein